MAETKEQAARKEQTAGFGTESARAVTFGRGYLRDLAQFSADATLSSEQNEQLEHKAKSRTRCLVELLATFPCCPHKGLSE